MGRRGKGSWSKGIFSPPPFNAWHDTHEGFMCGHFAILCCCDANPRHAPPLPLKASQRGLMARAEATRWRRPRPLGLGRGGIGARPLRVGRSSCGRYSIRRRPAPVLRSGSPVSWGRYHAPSPRPLNPAPMGSASQEMPPCSAVPPLFQICSSALEHGFAPAFVGLAHAFLSFVPDK